MRDLESLDQAGIPIQAFYGIDGGYQIMDSYVLEKQAATRHEYDWLVAALKGMASAYASILSFGNHVRVIEPQELKERILKTCREIQAEYESESS